MDHATPDIPICSQVIFNPLPPINVTTCFGTDMHAAHGRYVFAHKYTTVCTYSWHGSGKILSCPGVFCPYLDGWQNDIPLRLTAEIIGDYVRHVRERTVTRTEQMDAQHKGISLEPMTDT